VSTEANAAILEVYYIDYITAVVHVCE